MLPINYAAESARYGNLSRVAIDFHITNGNLAELDAAVCYARAAAYFARLALTNAPQPHSFDTCIEIVGDAAIRSIQQVRVF